MFTRSCFNPRTYIRYDISRFRPPYSFPCFNPRTYIRYDKRPWALIVFIFVFQSTYLYKVRHELGIRSKRQTGFNPRTYIRYDLQTYYATVITVKFQSTYLYKVRPHLFLLHLHTILFQSTYLYKVRRNGFLCFIPVLSVSIHVPI